jgi:EAL domain-containing protein (putative c-di-GMP-specific phosphodiesterase class I)
MDHDVELRAATELDLRHALGNGELELHYQPIVSAQDLQVSGYEALLRWRNPLRGFVSPAVFIPIAEEIGAIMAIGEWALRQACCDAAKWAHPRDVSVNVSAVQLRNGNFVATVMSAIAYSGIHPSRLILELTESALIVDTAQILVTLNEIKELGVRISLDDFGTGYSSLSYLRKFPIDKVKIDKSFVDEVTVREECLAIIESIVRLCDILNMTTVAEGVETREQLEKLSAIGCKELQGYHLARPKPFSELGETLLIEGGVLPRAA